MLTNRQNFLETIKKDGKPDRLCACFTALKPIGSDPVFRFVRGNRIRGTDSVDRWGTFISFPEDQPAAIPVVTPENQVIKDMENWREYVRVPDLRANCAEGWETARAIRDGIDKNEYLTMTVMGTGIFEQLHMLMTFEDTLCNLLLYPDEMHELIEVIAGYRLQYMKLIVENLRPDAILSHDDWGSEKSMMMAPETWREFFKEPYRRLYSYLHDNGVLVIHHADSFLEPIAGDMAEIGIDVWQGVLPTNDIVKLSGLLDGKMALMGGISSVIDRRDVTEKEIRGEVCRCLNEYGELPGFIPGITYGGPGTIFPEVEPVIIDEIERYNKDRFGVRA
ncbi:MAG: uroporphyrinogen decarboxylase (URO-D) [Clostridiales bacterium]|nr:uroporphyrinogen decarboxylase (URO-D) [Clostridiales bacterium]